MRAESAGDAHLGDRHGEPTLADVVAGTDETRPDRPVETSVSLGRVEIGCRRWTRVARWSCDWTMSRCDPANSARVPPDEHQHVVRRRQVGGDARVGVGHVGDRGDHQRRRHGVALSVVAEVLVVERVLARHERRPVEVGRRAAAGDRGHEFAERRGSAWVAPREVVEQGNAIGVGADGDDVADRLVDDGDGHVLGVGQPVPRVDADADREAFGSPTARRSRRRRRARRRGRRSAAAPPSSRGSRGRSDG